MFGRAFANQTTANKNFMVMERPSKSSPFTNPVVQESNANRSTGFKKFGNIQQQNNFGLQSTQPRFPKQNNAFNKNLPHFSNGMSLEEEKQLQNNNQTNQNPFFGRQGRNRNPKEFQPKIDETQPQDFKGNNFTRIRNNLAPNNQFPNYGFPKKNQFRSSSNNMELEENQNQNEERNFPTSFNQNNNFQERNSRNNFPNSRNPNAFRKNEPANNQNRSSQMKFKQRNVSPHPEMEFENDQEKELKPRQKNSRQSNFEGDQEPPKLDMQKWGGRIVKKNDMQQQRGKVQNQEDFEDEPQAFSRERSRTVSKSTYQKKKRNFEENDQEDSSPEPKEPSDFQTLKQRLMQKRNFKKNEINDENIQKNQDLKKPPNRSNFERNQKPHERMIRRYIAQPKMRQDPENVGMPRMMGRSYKNGQEKIKNENYEEPQEEEHDIKMTSKFLKTTGSLNEKEKKQNGNLVNPMDLKEKLKKKFLKPQEEIEEGAPPSLNGKWRMCAESEGRLREISRQLDIFERDPDYFLDGHWVDELPRVKPEWCIKKYSRSDAGKEYEQPFPLNVLENTLNYIIDNIVDVDNQRNVPYMTKLGDDTHSFFDIYDFVYDRFRGINKDLTVLKLDTRKETIDIIEKMLRFFILSINEGSDNQEFGMFRNIERITDFLTTLITSYKKARESLKIFLLKENEEIMNQGGSQKNFYISPNEAEFFAYILIFTFDKPLEMEKNLGILGDKDFDEIRNSPEITFALKVISSIRELNTVEYFRLMKKANYFEACSIYYFINKIRNGCLDQFSRMSLKNKNDDGILNPISLSYLQNLLYFNNYKDLLKYLEAFGLDISYLNLEDSFEDETQIQTSFLKDWRTYEEAKNYEILTKFWQKNKKIDEKKSIRNFPLFPGSKTQMNYFNNEDVSRKFLLNGEWKKNDSIPYEKRLIYKICNDNKVEPKIPITINQPFLVPPKQKIVNQVIKPQPEQKIEKEIPIFNETKTIKNIPTSTSIPHNNFNTFSYGNIDKNPEVFPKRVEIPNTNFNVSIIAPVQPIKKIISKEIQMEKKEKLLRAFMKKRQNKIKTDCFYSWVQYKTENLVQKEYEKEEIGKIFYYDFRSELNSQIKGDLDNLRESYNNFLSSFKSEKHSNDFISEIASSLFRYSMPSQKKIFFKVCLFTNALDNSSNEISQICQEAFCGNQKLTKRRFNFRIDENSEKEILFCSRLMTPLNEIITDKNPTKKMNLLKNNLIGSDLLIFVISENFYEDAGYFKMFTAYLAKYGLDNLKSIFLRVSSNSKSALAQEKREMIQKFGLKEQQEEKKFKIMNCEINSSDNFCLNKISLHLKKMFQDKIKDEKFMTIKFVEIFTNIYHILKSKHDDEKIHERLSNDGFKSYFFNKNLINTCLAKFYHSFSKSLNEFSEIPAELITLKEEKKIMKIKKQKDILLYLMQNCFLDQMDKKYRKMIKMKICKFFDYTILEEILIKYLRGFLLFEDEEIFDAINKYMVPFYEYFNYQQSYGIEGCWNEFFLALLKCLYFLFKRHNFYIRIETTFDFEIDPNDFVILTEKEIENHICWIKNIKNYAEFEVNPINSQCFGKRKSDNDLTDVFQGFKREKKLCLEKKEKMNQKDLISIF